MTALLSQVMLLGALVTDAKGNPVVMEMPYASGSHFGLPSYLLVATALFAIGFFGVLLRKNTLVIYMCLELMLIASTLGLVAFSRFNNPLDGRVFVFFI